ncbi:MAG: hypothetical protein B6I36_11285 [Desulfobacteraceae bacterium 4572_35.1]|nr:MAG: hypothetical protein B6I36_11285 [Desulfobacteraceae bacterium 4572_35.1]
MNNNIFYFGEKVDNYDVKVLNEREVRASAGILFLFAFISFLNSWLVGDFTFTKIFVIAFLIDFSIRIFINPKYSPSMILGRLAVSNQKVEYVGAPQKKFAWSIGLILAISMFYLLVVKNVIGPVNLFICLTCLLLLFFESVFGICIACKIYDLFHQKKAKLCPGNVCEINSKEEIQKTSTVQIIIMILFLILVYFISNSALIGTIHGLQAQSAETTTLLEKSAEKKCVVPDWAIKMGHEEKWKLHNGCK